MSFVKVSLEEWKGRRVGEDGEDRRAKEKYALVELTVVVIIANDKTADGVVHIVLEVICQIHILLAISLPLPSPKHPLTSPTVLILGNLDHTGRERDEEKARKC